MANPSYSFNDVDFTTLPGAYRHGGKPRSRVISDVHLESDFGAEFNYELFEREDVLTLNFRVTESELDTHETLFDLLRGRGGKVYLSLDGAGAPTSIYVRCSDSMFDPQELDSPAKVGGSFTSMYDLTWRFHTAID